MTDTQMIIGRYVVEAQIGAGGMGMVYRAVDGKTGQIVAIKQLNVGITRTDMIERFRREGEALRALNHPNIVMLLDTLEENGSSYIIMEYVPGGDLTALLNRGKLSNERILRLSIDLADALTRAHKLNIIHRDLKPANILIAPDGTLKLSDFGVAHFADKQRVTGMDGIVGTMDYIAPEVLKGEIPDGRVDIWAFGVMLYEMLAGKRPFTGQTMGEVVGAILTKNIPDLEAECPTAPTALIDLIYRMLERDRNVRIASARLVGAELEAILQGRKTTTNTATLNDATVIQANPLVARFKTETPVALKRTMHNLPAQTTPFVGRETELQELSNLLRDPNIRLITIHAPGGMGKTRLSLECGGQQLHSFEHGVYVVQLAPLSDPAGIIPAIAEATGYPFQQDGRDQKQQILDYFNDKHMLLLLDNYEHLMAGAGLVTDILQAARQMRVIVTSRQRLNQSGETVFNLGAMDFPNWETPEDALEYAAVKLFLQSAKRTQPNFELTAKDLPFVARICRLVRGMPLGILLAASWLSTLSPEEIASEMESNLDFLETDLTDLPTRQRSLRAVFDYSWELLAEPEQQVFMRLSLFRGGFTREAAQTVAEANLRVLMSLINKSLLHRDVESGRYDVHELLRQFAEEKLTQWGEVGTTRTLHSQFFAAFVREREIDIKGRSQLTGLNALEADFENVQAAWLRAVSQKDGTTLEGMIEGVYWFCTFRTRIQTGIELFQRARDQWQMRPADQVSDVLTVKLHMRFPPSGDYKALLQWAVAIASRLGDRAELAFALRAQGLQLSHVEVNSAGLPLLEQSLAIYESIGDQFYAATVLDDLGWGYFLAAVNEKRIALVQRALEIRQRIGDRIGSANAQRNLSTATWVLDTEETMKWLRSSRAIGLEMKEIVGTAWTDIMLGAQLLWSSRFDEAAVFIEEAHQVLENMNVAPMKGLSYVMIGWLHGMRGDFQQGMAWTDNGIALIGDKINDPALRNFVIYALGVNSVGLNDYPRLIGLFASLKKMMSAMGMRELTDLPAWTANILTNVPPYVGYLAYRGRYEEAISSLSAAINHPSWFLKWQDTWGWLVDLQARLRQTLGDEVYDHAWERGKTMDIQIVITEMLALGD